MFSVNQYIITTARRNSHGSISGRNVSVNENQLVCTVWTSVTKQNFPSSEGTRRENFSNDLW